MTVQLRFTTLAAPLLAAALAFQARAEGTPWRISGDLSEACSCSVPCSCNFGEGPSPGHFCWAMWSLDIKEGHYGDLDLSGLRLAGASGSKGVVGYIDSRATPEQNTALKQIATAIAMSALRANGVKDPQAAPPDFRLRGFKTTTIDQEVSEKSNRLKIGDFGGFESSYIMGIDGKTPVVVENNWSWNIQHGIKAKTKYFRYKDAFGNSYDLKATNANQGKFDWSDTTPVYFR